MRTNFEPKPWLFPLPVLIIGTYDEHQNADAMNAAWGGLYDADLVQLCLSEGHKTTKNILTQKAFTVSFATKEQIVACDYVGLESGNTVSNKIEKAGWTTTASKIVNAPVINELPFTLECGFVKQTEDGNIIGHIENISVDPDYVKEGKFDVERAQFVSFDPIHNVYRVIGNAIANAFSAGNELK